MRVSGLVLIANIGIPLYRFDRSNIWRGGCKRLEGKRGGGREEGWGGVGWGGVGRVRVRRGYEGMREGMDPVWKS